MRKRKNFEALRRIGNDGTLHDSIQVKVLTSAVHNSLDLQTRRGRLTIYSKLGAQNIGMPLFFISYQFRFPSHTSVFHHAIVFSPGKGQKYPDQRPIFFLPSPEEWIFWLNSSWIKGTKNVPDRTFLAPIGCIQPTIYALFGVLDRSFPDVPKSNPRS